MLGNEAQAVECALDQFADFLSDRRQGMGATAEPGHKLVSLY